MCNTRETRFRISSEHPLSCGCKVRSASVRAHICHWVIAHTLSRRCVRQTEHCAFTWRTHSDLLLAASKVWRPLAPSCVRTVHKRTTTCCKLLIWHRSNSARRQSWRPWRQTSMLSDGERGIADIPNDVFQCEFVHMMTRTCSNNFRFWLPF